MRALVVAAHPDDEILGVGGTIARHVDSGDYVNIAIMATGAMARGDASLHDVDLLKSAARSAAEVLGAKSPTFFDFPDNRLDSVELIEVVRSLEALVAQVDPEIIYTHNRSDLNIDHEVTHRAVLTACRPKPGSNVKSIYCFETLSSTEWGNFAANMPFEPQRFVDISAYLDTKLRALEFYHAEMAPFPHPRSPEAVRSLAMLRGSSAGLLAAEAFSVAFERVTE